MCQGSCVVSHLSEKSEAAAYTIYQYFGQKQAFKINDDDKSNCKNDNDNYNKKE